jgi:hypothetical protein
MVRHAQPSGGVTGSTEIAQAPLYLPEIVEMFRAFVAEAASLGPVVIGIDELDKMSSEEHAASFLNDIKAIFGIDNCYFLISVSDDAVARFERRGIPVRDVFDSALDEILRLVPLSFRQASASLAERVVGLPIPFRALCYCLSGAFPAS